jgi:hypothetical protein
MTTDGAAGDGEYVMSARIDLTKDVSRTIAALSVVMAVVSTALFVSVYVLVTGKDISSSGRFSLAVTSVLLAIFELIVGCGLTIVFHELIHGLAYRLFGEKARYGYGISGILPYFSCTSGGRFRRNEYIAVLIAPLTAISAIGIAIMGLFPGVAWLALALLILNAIGTTADLWLAFTLLRYPPDALLSDDAKGTVVYLKPRPPGR